MVATRTDGPGNASSWALTDENGYYEIRTGLPTGTYDVTAGVYALLLKGEATGYTPKTTSGVKVTQVQETVNVEFNLDASGWISGKVTTSTGMPLFRVLVTANSTDGKSSGFEYTDNEGVYRITTGLPEGVYKVNAKYKDYSSSILCTVEEKAETPNVNFQLSVPSTGQVIGRVTDLAKGFPISGALVRIAAGSVAYDTTTDPKGYYSYLLGEGSYTVSTLVPGYVSNVTTVSVALNQIARVYYPTSSSVGFLVHKFSGTSSGIVSGTVTGEANPIPEFPIAVIPVTFSGAILLIILTSRRIRRVKTDR